MESTGAMEGEEKPSTTTAGSEILPEDSREYQIFNLVKEKLGSHEDLLRVRNNSGETILQTDCGIREEIIEFCEDMLEKSLFEELLPAESSEEKEFGCSE
ncbi:hypothetical protein J437_LFUL019391 [Ladona fulva]|uniref:Uncharacterized protein n=1 Tax=Ladona fulva TaxID=123851 RepID=A0A8K0KMR5_LADFU|nr:hypothetical protein J437_LFUL019391 [Ladona fulva]